MRFSVIAAAVLLGCVCPSGATTLAEKRAAEQKDLQKDELDRKTQQMKEESELRAQREVAEIDRLKKAADHLEQSQKAKINDAAEVAKKLAQEQNEIRKSVEEDIATRQKDVLERMKQGHSAEIERKTAEEWARRMLQKARQEYEAKRADIIRAAETWSAHPNATNPNETAPVAAPREAAPVPPVAAHEAVPVTEKRLRAVRLNRIDVYSENTVEDTAPGHHSHHHGSHHSSHHHSPPKPTELETPKPTDEPDSADMPAIAAGGDVVVQGPAVAVASGDAAVEVKPVSEGGHHSHHSSPPEEGEGFKQEDGGHHNHHHNHHHSADDKAGPHTHVTESYHKTVIIQERARFRSHATTKLAMATEKRESQTGSVLFWAITVPLSGAILMVYSTRRNQPYHRVSRGGYHEL